MSRKEYKEVLLIAENQINEGGFVDVEELG